MWENLGISVIFYLTLLMSVCIPLIPAIVIYRLFPKTTVGVSGPLKGLTIKAGGAFAAYVITLIVVFPLINKMYDTVGGFSKSFWTISVPIRLVDTEGKTVKDVPENFIDTAYMPNVYRITPNEVVLKIPEFNPKEPGTLRIQVEDFGSQLIDLKSYIKDKNLDKYNKTLSIQEPIDIHQNKATGRSYDENSYANQ